MGQIPLLFERDPTGGVGDALSNDAPHPSLDWTATEYVNGANVRLTVRAGTLVRLEVRHRPTREQTEQGISSPWYREASPKSARNADYWLWEAAENTSLVGIPDGEWSGEAVGPKIKGNQLQLDSHRVILSSLVPWRESLPSSVSLPPQIDCPIDFEGLYEFFGYATSKINPLTPLYGVVWWHFDEPVAKVRRSDFHG